MSSSLDSSLPSSATESGEGEREPLLPAPAAPWGSVKAPSAAEIWAQVPPELVALLPKIGIASLVLAILAAVTAVVVHFAPQEEELMVEVEEAAESECPLSKGEWQPWSECSASCSGVQRRIRTSWRCWEVVENRTAQRPCNEEVICDSQACELGDWSSWKVPPVSRPCQRPAALPLSHLEDWPELVCFCRRHVGHLKGFVCQKCSIMSNTMRAMVIFSSLLLLAGSHRIIGGRRGIAQTASRGSMPEAGEAPDSLRCEEELRILKKEIQESCEKDQRDGAPVSDGGCHAEAEGVVSDGDYEVWSQNLLKCGPEKTYLLLWSGYRDDEREDVLRPLRERGGCLLQSQEKADTRLGELLNADGVNTLKSCSWTKVKAFWVGASRQFASTWASRSQDVTVAIGYHIEQGQSYKTLFDTVFYRSELKAAVQAFREELRVRIFYTHPAMRFVDGHAATSVIYERARLLSPVTNTRFQKTTTWMFDSCSVYCASASYLFDPEDSDSLNNLGWMYLGGYGVARNVDTALKKIELAVERGGARAPTSLGNLYRLGEGVRQDLHKAKELYEIGSERGDVFAAKNLGDMYYSGRGVMQDFHKARELYQLAIARGSIDAGHNLGHMYRWGLGVARDFEKARELFQLAVDRGDALAPNNLANLYVDGLGVAKDMLKAKELYEIGVEKGDKSAACNLGNMYHDGLAVAQDFQKARELYEMAIARGSAEAAAKLGYMYQRGRGVARDLEKAGELFQLAVERGDAGATNNLGGMYQLGKGVAQDVHKAKELYEMGTERGDGCAPKNLGDIYYDGLGVVPDFRKSRKLYEIARSRGCADAINSLAWLYHHGLGVSQNFLKARELYEEASGQGDIDGMFNLALLRKMPGMGKPPVSWPNGTAESPPQAGCRALLQRYSCRAWPTAPDCPSLVERRSCERRRPCPEECQKVLGHWAEWSSCSAMCDIGERWRIREMPPGAPAILQARCRICPCKHLEGSKPCSARAAPNNRSRTSQHALVQEMLLNLHCPRERRHLIIRDERRRNEVLRALATNAAGSLVLSRHLPIMPASISGWELLSLGNESRRKHLSGRLQSAEQFPIEATFEGDGGDLGRLRSCLSGWFASHLHLTSGQLNLTSPHVPQDFDRSLRLGLRLRIPCTTQDADEREPSCGRWQIS
eukprot:s589_g19.t2